MLGYLGRGAGPSDVVVTGRKHIDGPPARGRSFWHRSFFLGRWCSDDMEWLGRGRTSAATAVSLGERLQRVDELRVDFGGGVFHRFRAENGRLALRTQDFRH